MALAMWETLKEAIVAYTGLSPATFFTVLALAVAFYYAISGFLEPSPPPRSRGFEVERESIPPPVQVGEITEEELKAYDGSDIKKPLLMAIKGQIYDVSLGRDFYGPGGPYALFAGKDASRALAKMSFEEKDLNGDISDLGPFELETLNDWEYKFMGKYSKVGTVKKSAPVTDEPVDNSSQTADAAVKPKGESSEYPEEHTKEVTESAKNPEEHAKEVTVGDVAKE